jgi:hypothetical protein
MPGSLLVLLNGAAPQEQARKKRRFKEAPFSFPIAVLILPPAGHIFE